MRVKEGGDIGFEVFGRGGGEVDGELGERGEEGRKVGMEEGEVMGEEVGVVREEGGNGEELLGELVRWGMWLKR